jgi:hypothetical protein
VETGVIRIFFVLAAFSFLCVAAAFFLGIRIGDYQAITGSGMPQPLREEFMALARTHLLIGLGAALVVILVNSIAITYFIGTGRWCKEVVERYGLDRAFIARSAALKRRAFPWAVLSMVAIMTVAALGAASDPGNGMKNTADWVMPHFVAAALAAAILIFASAVQGVWLHEQYNVIQEILSEVRRVRMQRGMPT